VAKGVFQRHLLACLNEIRGSGRDFGADKMHDNHSGLEFVRYAWGRRKIPAIACAIGVVVAALVTFLLPERYTATATILIEPPAGNDPRAATAVSTVYLESLKTYEHLVTSDSLFAAALEKLGLRKRYEGATIEELKRKMLAVSKPASTSLIEVSATLTNPIEAQHLAETLAEDAVGLNSSLDQQSNEEILREPMRIYVEAKARRERAEQGQASFLKETSRLTLEQKVSAAEALRTQVDSDLAREKTSLAAYEGQRSAGVPQDAGTGPGWADMQISTSSARIRELEKQETALTDFLHENVPTVEELKRRAETIESELRAARVEEESAMTRLRDIQSSSAVRRVRITVLDPGIVPQKPSSPNLLLNLISAFLLALMGSTGFLALGFSQPRLRARDEEPVFVRV